MKKVIVRESTRVKTESALKTKGIDLTVLWDTAYCKHGNVNTRIKVKCNVCGSIGDKTLGSLTCGKSFCETCLVHRFEAACSSVNLKYISKYYVNKKIVKLITECTICGEKSDVFGSNIMKGLFRCDACMLNRYKTALLTKNCTFIKLDDNFIKNHRVYYHNHAGDCFNAASSNILHGKFTNSVDGSWSCNHSVYVILLNVSSSLQLCKIGTAVDPVRRAETLKLNKDYNVFTLESFSTRYEADKLESKLHKEFSTYRLRSEIASNYTNGLVSRKFSDGTRRLIKDGVTEWFSSEAFTVLSKRYNLE